VASSPVTPPPGYQIESAPQGGSLPPGYQIEGQGQPAQPGIMSKVGDVVNDVGLGAVKGVWDTASGVSSLLNKIPGVGETLAPSAGVAAMKQTAQPTNTAQSVGKGAEDIGEFFLGDEALKGVSLGEKALKAAGLAEKYEKASPFVRKAIEHIMTGARAGTVAGTETTAKTGDVKQGLEAGAAAGAGGTALSAVGDALGSGLKYIQAAKAFKELPGALDKGLTETISQKAVADGLKATAGDTAAEHLADSALQYKERAKQGYELVDNAVNGELQPIQDKLKATKKAISIQSNLDPEKADALKATKADLEKKLSETIAKAKANGVPDAEDVIKKADADYNTFHAQSQLSTQLARKATETGGASPAGMQTWARNLGTPKVVGQTSRLEQALGKDGAEAVHNLTQEGLAKAKELATQAAVGNEIKKAAVKGAAGTVGATAVGYPAYRVLSGH
jgi:hypothetical protein